MRIRLGYLCSFILPVSVAVFLSSGPHGAAAAIAWTMPVWALVLADRFSPKVAAQPLSPVASPQFYDGILYTLAALQLLNIVLMLRYVENLIFALPDAFAVSICNLITVRILVGTSSGSSGIIAAHELIHRPDRYSKLLGRVLLWTVAYDHFAIAHIRGHHFHVGMRQDIATARYGESFTLYWKRVYREHFLYAWHSEAARLQMNAASLRSANLFGNRVLHGLAIEALLLITILSVFGWLAALMFIYQAFAAVRLLEAINYFQHWGLVNGRSSNTLAWVNDSCLTQYCLIGLSNHIEHHRNAALPYYRLPSSSRGPKMPYGYFVMNLWVKLDNASYQAMALRELEKYAHSGAQQADLQTIRSA